MSGQRMAGFGYGRAEIAEDENPHRCGQARLGPARIDVRADLVHTQVLALANILQRLPHRRFEPHARAVPIHRDVTVDEGACLAALR